MRWRFIFYLIGILIFILGLTMVFPLLCGLYYKDQSVIPLLKSMAIAVAVGLFLYTVFRGQSTGHISQREGIAIVAFGWISAGLLGAIPFYLGGIFETFGDAVFESVSGFTTTGSSVLTNIEAVPKGLLFLRSLIQWLGGMGIIVLSVAILPFLGVGGMQLY
ncbi:MAG: TrkH family potassium uptake protein, partial [Deltaproteobacteria bacterium]|nr:TrkH family potassium uptake protein [Deltaproteobacteria bacterium]